MSEIENQRVKDYKSVFLTGKGKDVLIDLIRSNEVMEYIQVDQTHPQGLAYREGQRRVIMQILEIINKDVFEIKQEMTEYERRFNE